MSTMATLFGEVDSEKAKNISRSISKLLGAEGATNGEAFVAFGFMASYLISQVPVGYQAHASEFFKTMVDTQVAMANGH